MLIRKANGEHELFQQTKLETSLRTAGADEKVVEKIVAHIKLDLNDDSTTSDIYNHAFELLKHYGNRPAAARYSLKRAVIELGPTGFPFEKLLAEVFKTQGYKTRTNVIMKGKCITHEVDFLGEREDKLIAGEAKFHNRSGMKTDLKVALYIDARYRDLVDSKYSGLCNKEQICEYWLITNTHFTKNARSYTECRGGIKLVGWDYPKDHNLQVMIEETGLHPLTCLTTLSKEQKRQLFDLGTVLCRSIRDDGSILRRIGIVGQKADDVIEEVTSLCGHPQVA